jgi:tetratricopeptide (TPR) repeat protein
MEAELLYQRGLPPKATYTFKHGLVQDTAYQSLLESQRVDLHGRIADALEKQFPDRVAREPEEIARHCEEADRTEEAIAHYQRAGERATLRSALAEAIAHLQRALELLHTLPESPQRDQQELRLQIGLGASLKVARGAWAPEVAQAYGHVLSLSQDLGDAPERFQALAGLQAFYRNYELTRALELGEDLLAHAKRTGERSQLLVAHSSLGMALYYHGQLTEALLHEEEAIALYDPIEHRSLESVYTQNPGIVSLCIASAALMQLGHPDRALERVEEAIEHARVHAEPYNLAYALFWGAVVNYVLGELRRALEHAEESIEISSEQGLRAQLLGSSLVRACALVFVADKDVLDLPSIVIKGLDGSVGLQSGSATDLESLVDAFRRLHRLDDALGFVEGWLAYSAKTHAAYWDAEFLRQKGEIRLEQDPAAREEAVSLFLRAIATAKSQEGKFFELRAATSLARLLLGRGERDEARALLAPVYDWFTEGFDTKDLKDAKVLLDELA